MRQAEIVKAWNETIIIPTYEIGEAEKYPIFLDKRVYQGSSGVVYPHPVIEKIHSEKKDKAWEVVFLENQYLKIMILPALGGRIQMAYDKVKQRHFVYYNEVIKPALVGLTGPWISGGIEFNWPQHHRPSTYDPVDHTIEENQDGSITVWVSELERMFRTKGMAGFTLYPDKAYLEIKGKLYNRTPHPQTFLWWANPAVQVNDDYQSVFPPDVHAVFDHGKRDVSTFPIATGTYYKVDYSAGVDISKYKNIPVPTSYMAVKSDYDFVGGYENDIEAGLLHIADHHISPGKKQWTWGNGEFGYAWDRNLTDQNGPYIELMCGVYTDNQPDFSWIQPYEERNFKQYFMPYQHVGMVKNASKDALIHVSENDGKILIKVYTTAQYDQSTIKLCSKDTILLEERYNLSPANSFITTISTQGLVITDLQAEVCNSEGQVLVSWKPFIEESQTIPSPAKAAKAPEEIESIEELYLTGLHIEQYRHATFNPIDYYQEALQRNPKDIRCNNALGLQLLKKGKFDQATLHFNTAIQTLTHFNPNPYDGEAYFNHGLALKFQGKWAEAYTSFFKATWNAAWQDAAYFNLAQIDCARANFSKALELLDASLIKNWHNHKARHLKVTILRLTNQKEAALQCIEDALKVDKFNFGVLFEKYNLSGLAEDKAFFIELIRNEVHSYLEYALDYAQAGLYQEAITLLNVFVEGKEKVYPMVYYYLGYFYQQQNIPSKAIKMYHLAAKMPSDYCFPNRLEEVLILQDAINLIPQDSKALYYLGNFWLANKQYENAKTCWETSIQLDDKFPIAHRNLALIYYNHFSLKEEALILLEKTFELDQANPRILMELDQLYKKLNQSPLKRFRQLQNFMPLVEQRDDLYLEYIALLNRNAKHELALEMILQRKFHPWEGGEGKVTGQYVLANLEIAKLALVKKDYLKAIHHLEQAQEYPHNLGEGKLYGTQENDIFYWLGCAYEGLNDLEKAKNAWKKASEGLDDPSPAMFYNDQQPDKIFYQGLALKKLGKEGDAHLRFDKLIQYGETHLHDKVKIDYFAVSLPDLLIWDEDLSFRNQIHCWYLIALGKLGKQAINAANVAFFEVLQKDIYHQGAFYHQKLTQYNFQEV